MARPPKPTRLKMLHGDRPSRINTSEPVPSMREVKPPRGMGREARRVWDFLAGDLIDKEVLTHWDVPLFAQFCEAVGRAQRANAKLLEEGEIIETKAGRVKNPWFQVWRDSHGLATSLAAKFGLTPSARSQLSIDTVRKDQAGRRLLTPPSDLLS